jgi:hypothetical protein
MIKRGHSHRPLDTFADSMLLKGVSIEIVSKLLGYSSIKMTERHCEPWVKARQKQLEAEVRRIWNTGVAPPGASPQLRPAVPQQQCVQDFGNRLRYTRSTRSIRKPARAMQEGMSRVSRSPSNTP